MANNWVVGNLQNALDTWNHKLGEIWQLVNQTPETFKDGAIWKVMVNIHGAVQAIGLALLVVFFLVGVIRTCSSFVEAKKPEHAVKLFVRFGLSYVVVTYGMDLMLAIFKIVQGITTTIMESAGFGDHTTMSIPGELIQKIEGLRLF